MKKIIFTAVAAISMSVGGYFLAKELDLFPVASLPAEDKKPKEKNAGTLADELKAESLRDGMTEIGGLSYARARGLFLSVKLGSEDVVPNNLYYALIALSDRLVRENPEDSMALAKDKTNPTNYMKQQMLFSSLARFYPEKIFQMKNNLPEEQWMVSQCLTAYFNTLITEDKDLAMKIFHNDFFANNIVGWNEMKAGCVSALAKVDKDLFLEQINEQENKSTANYLFRYIVENYSADNYKEGIAWALERLNDSQKRAFFGMMVERLGREDWKVAFAVAEDFAVKSGNGDSFLWEGFDHWAFDNAIIEAAQEDPVAAIDFIERVYRGSQREDALAKVLGVLIEKQPANSMVSLIEQLPKGMCRYQVMPVFMKKYYEEDPAASVQWMLKHIPSDEIGDHYQSAIWNGMSLENVVSLGEALLDTKNGSSVLYSLAGYFAYEGGTEKGEDFGKTLSTENAMEYYADFYQSLGYQAPEKAWKLAVANEYLDSRRDEVLKNLIENNYDSGRMDIIFADLANADIARLAGEIVVERGVEIDKMKIPDSVRPMFNDAVEKAKEKQNNAEKEEEFTGFNKDASAG